jgi:hypothetical protein
MSIDPATAKYRATERFSFGYVDPAAMMGSKKPPISMLEPKDLESSAGRATLSTLVGVWRVRFGDTWVNAQELTDDFYRVAAIRLVNANFLERHILDNGQTVLRLIEKT